MSSSDSLEIINEEKIENTIEETIAELEKLTPERKIIDLSPDMEIAMTQKYVPQCKMCNSPLRFEAEKYYARNNQVPQRVRLWLQKEHNEKWTWESIAIHMRDHCIWDSPIVNFKERVASKIEELSIIRQDRLGWYSEALTASLLDMASVNIAALPIDDAVKIQQAICKTAQIQAQLVKTQADISGAQQQAKAIIDSHNEKIFTFLQELLSVVDEKQKNKIMELIREFQATDY